VLKQRARREDDKQQRRDALLKAARALFERSPRLDTTIAEIAERAGVAKGTVFLYFSTREELELAVLELELASWFDAIDEELDAEGMWTAQRVCATLVSSVVLRKLMIRLLSRLELVIEHNVAPASIERFKRWLLARMVDTGARIERRVPRLAAGAGVRFVLYLRALLTGLWMMSDPAPAVAKALERDDMTPLRVNFEREFEQALSAILCGLTQEAGDD
jgi:AcrR family transcriptional regulator